MGNSVVIKRSDFRHPTKEEIRAIKHLIPKLNLFSFKEVDEISEILDKKKSLEDVHYLNNLYWWNFSLLNRRGILVHAYEEVLVHYKRGVQDDFKKHNNIDIVNRIQFNFFCETYLYLFSSFKDSLGQLLNIYFKLGVDEDKLHFNLPFVKKITDTKIELLLGDFLNATKELNKIRNSFAHRYPMTYNDYRTSLKFDKNSPSLGMGGKTGILASELFDKIVKSYHLLSSLLDELILIII